MAADRLERILGRLVALGVDVGPAALCEVGRDVLAVSGSGMLLLAEPDLRVSVDGGDVVVGRLHRLQLDLGEGPALEAHRDGVAVLEPRLTETHRWPAFAFAAAAEGAEAIFCAPARVGAVRLGTFTAWRDRPGELTVEQHGDLLVLGLLAARLLLDAQLGISPTDSVSITDEGIEFDSIVHQAVGMLSVQLGVSLHVAMLRLRGHAFASGVPVTQVAAAVVGRTLRLELEEPGAG